jgi:hypothetical protein
MYAKRRIFVCQVATSRANFREFPFRDCMKKGRRVVIRYSSRYEKALPNRSIRCRMELHRASHAPCQGTRASEDP